MPWGRRKQLAYRPELARAVLQAALDEVFGWARGTARERLGLEDVRTGAVTVTQRFGSSLALNGHCHSILPDGVWAVGEGGALVFHRLSPTRGELQALVERIGARCEALFAEQDDEEPEDAHAVLIAASASAGGGRAAGGERGASAGGAGFESPTDVDAAVDRAAFSRELLELQITYLAE